MTFDYSTTYKDKVSTLNKNRQFGYDLKVLKENGASVPLVGSFNEIVITIEIALAVIFKNVTHLKRRRATS